MELDELIGKMRARVAQCRRLADGTSDARTASILRSMADEGEADIKRLLEEKSESRGKDVRTYRSVGNENIAGREFKALEYQIFSHMKPVWPILRTPLLPSLEIT